MSYEKHGHARVGAHSRTYICWLNMRARCSKPTNRDFHNYGGRGITVCQRWRDSFSSFLADMGELPDGLTIERINNDGNYEPGNCRWATYLEQGANTRKAKNISSDGLRMPQIRWSLKLSSNKELVRRRIEMGLEARRGSNDPAPKGGRDKGAPKRSRSQWEVRSLPVNATKDGRVIRSGKAYTDFRSSLHRKQNNQCHRCGRTTILTADPINDFSFHVHHKDGRGMGGSKRDDTFESCEGLCGKCHRKEHGQS